ncbi:HAD-IA family hydrolase [Tropicimonas sp. S265A]|uniref:HAD-IA family hydrolase n=1 Tax=Tropicimonas sp. S265A TaxID=3415134 RepID=UPI003C7EB065
MSRTVIFDLDGTLADTSADLIAAANHCFAARGHGTPLDPQADAATAFRGGRAMLRLGLTRLGLPWTERDVDADYPVLLAAYGDAIDVHTTLYPGAVAAVERLRARGDKVGICTNKPEGLAETLMQRLGVRDMFAALIGADTLPVRKPDPAPLRETVARVGGDMARATLIGDTVTDRDTARAAGIPCVLVTFGPTGRAVAELQPEALLDHYDLLEHQLERIIPL